MNNEKKKSRSGKRLIKNKYNSIVARKGDDVNAKKSTASKAKRQYDAATGCG